jgi:ATP-binding cassette subfamily E protein 1
LESQVTHRYSANSFKLHRLPMPRPGQVLGLVGTNGIGKSTALKILSGKLKPNLGRYDNPPDWEEILRYFRGSELQSQFIYPQFESLFVLTSIDYFTKVLEDDLKAVVKPQYVDQIPRAVKGPTKNVGDLLKARAQMDNMESILDDLGTFCYILESGAPINLSLQSSDRFRTVILITSPEESFSDLPLV